MIDVTKAKHISTVARELAKDIREGSVSPGFSKLFEEFGEPCCSMGHLLARCGLMGESCENPYFPIAEFVGVNYGESEMVFTDKGERIPANIKPVPRLIYKAIRHVIGRNDARSRYYKERPSLLAGTLEDFADVLEAAHE